jgi:hypothetical protein
MSAADSHHSTIGNTFCPWDHVFREFDGRRRKCVVVKIIGE